MADDRRRDESEDELRHRARELLRDGLTVPRSNDLRNTLNFFEESLALCRLLSGAERQRAVCPFDIGTLSVRLGYCRDAAVCYDESTDLFHRIPGGQRDASDLRTPLTPQTGWVRVGSRIASSVRHPARTPPPSGTGSWYRAWRAPRWSCGGSITHSSRGQRDRAVVVDDMAARFDGKDDSRRHPSSLSGRPAPPLTRRQPGHQTIPTDFAETLTGLDAMKLVSILGLAGFVDLRCSGRRD